MSKGQEIDCRVSSQTLYAMVRATKDCSKRRRVLQLNRNINQVELQQKQLVFHLGSSSTNLNFQINYAKTVYFQ